MGGFEMQSRFATCQRVLGLTLVFFGLFGGLGAREALAENEFRFAWTVPSRAVVTETVLKKGKTATLRYEIKLSAPPGSTNLHLRLENLSFLKVEGWNMSDKKVQNEVKRLEALASAIPTLVVSRSGKLVGLKGLDEMIEKILSQSGADENRRREIAKMMRTPQVFRSLEKKCAEFWTAWVSLWVGLEVAPGEKLPVAQEIPLPDGNTLLVPGNVTRRQPDPHAPADAVLEMESLLEGEVARRAFGDAIAHLIPQASRMERLSRATKVRAITDPQTLRPRSVTMETVTNLKMEGELATELVERHIYHFDWK
ncbi:MAG: hypothetical protein HYY84_14195 [Deltaproteobacteria bacterium]|nr:hypothetical protein [Deltaproteobacteria bacterium]